MREKKAPAGKKMKRAKNKGGARALKGKTYGAKKARKVRQSPKGRKSY